MADIESPTALTPAGLEVTEKARKAFGETFIGLIDYLGEEDSEMLADLLTKVQQYFHDQAVNEKE